jgi:hypothetical protein
VNTHLQLIWSSVFAPRAAADLALQHPDTNRLGWMYALILGALTLAFEVFVRYQGQQGAGPMATSQISSSLAFAFYFAISYFCLRWFWRVMVDDNVSQRMIDAALAVSFACSIAILLLKYVLYEFFEVSSSPFQLLGIVLPIAAGITLSSVAFQYVFNISIGRAVIVNVMANVLLFLAFLIMMFSLLFVFPATFGEPLEFNRHI